MTVTLEQAKEQLEQLAQQADQGEAVLIARDDAPSLRLSVDAPRKSRLGTLEGLWTIPDDIKTPFAEEIDEMFYGNPNKLNP